MRGWNGGRMAAIAVLVGAGMLLGNTAQAALPKASKTGASKSVLQKLHQAKELLEHADHDYDGYRAKAHHEVSSAIKELLHHKHLHAKSTGAKAAPGKRTVAKAPVGNAKKGSKGKNSEPQAVSDKQLHEALALLKTSAPEITKHHAAHHHVEEAIGNLHTALKIK